MSALDPPSTPAQETDLSVQVGPLRLSNPLMTASGTAGLGLELDPFMDLKDAGAIVVKTLTNLPRHGNPMPRLHETPSGLLNSIGLPNKGLDHFIAEVMPRLAGRADCLIVNIAGTCTEEFGGMAAKLDEIEGVDGLELNISCPNVDGGDLPFGRDPEVVSRLVKDVRQATKLPVITKLSPNVSDIGSIAKAAEEAGSDALSLVNTVLGMAVDWRTKKPCLGTVVGGLSGPAIKPIAVRMVWEVANAVEIPVIGIGGVRNVDDVLEFMVAGASAVQVGTTHYGTPDIIPRLVKDLDEAMTSMGQRRVADLIGTLET